MAPRTVVHGRRRPFDGSRSWPRCGVGDRHHRHRDRHDHRRTAIDPQRWDGTRQVDEEQYDRAAEVHGNRGAVAGPVVTVLRFDEKAVAEPLPGSSAQFFRRPAWTPRHSFITHRDSRVRASGGPGWCGSGPDVCRAARRGSRSRVCTLPSKNAPKRAVLTDNAQSAGFRSIEAIRGESWELLGLSGIWLQKSEARSRSLTGAWPFRLLTSDF